MKTNLTIPELLSGSHDKELRVLVAEARGWRKIRVVDYKMGERPTLRGIPSHLDDSWEDCFHVPKFSTSLDATRELLADLTEDAWPWFETELRRCRGIARDLWNSAGQMYLRATARQICVAYLIVKGVLK